MKKPVIEQGGMHTLLESQLGGNPIEASEARGQQQLVASESIPSNWGGYPTTEQQADRDMILKELGFELGAPFDDDPLFRPCKLPPGWSKSATGHSMHSDIVDQNGYRRIGMFFKAAFYDRRASLSLKRRVSYTVNPKHGYDPDVSHWIAYANDTGNDILILAEFETPLTGAPLEEHGKAEQAAQAYVEEHYPDHANPIAYWDTDIEGERFTHHE